MLGNIYYTLDKYSHCWNTSNNMSSLYLCLPKNNVVPVLMSPYNVIFPKHMSFLYWYPLYTNTLCTLKYWYSPYINVPCTTELLGLKTLGLWRLGILVPLDEFPILLQNFIVLLNTITNPYLGWHESKSGDKAEPIP